MSDLMWAHADEEMKRLEAAGTWRRLTNEELKEELPAPEGQDEAWVGITFLPRLSLGAVLSILALLLGLIEHVAHR